MYKVIVRFNERFDSNHLYEVGAQYPRFGFTPTPERIQELSEGTNRIGVKYIEAGAPKAKSAAAKKPAKAEPETVEANEVPAWIPKN